jgi:hypothetical protein
MRSVGLKTQWLIHHQARAFFASFFFDSGTDEPDVRLIAKLPAIILMAKHHPNEGRSSAAVRR